MKFKVWKFGYLEAYASILFKWHFRLVVSPILGLVSSVNTFLLNYHPDTLSVLSVVVSLSLLLL